MTAPKPKAPFFFVAAVLLFGAPDWFGPDRLLSADTETARSRVARLEGQYRAHPERWWLPRDIGYIYLTELKDFAQANSQLELARRNFEKHEPNGKHAWLYYLVGESLRRGGKHAEAVKAFRAGLHRSPIEVEEMNLRRGLGDSLLELRQFQGALSHLRAALKACRRPDDAESVRALLLRALVGAGDFLLLQKQQTEAARLLYSEAVSLQPASTPGAIYEGETGLRLYIAEHPATPSPDRIHIRGVIVHCTVQGFASTEDYRFRLQTAILLFTKYFAAVSGGRVEVHLEQHEPDCRLTRTTAFRGHVGPVLESAENSDALFRLFRHTIQKADFYVIAYPGFPGARTSGTYGYLMPLGNGVVGPGRSRIDLSGISLRGLIHEFGGHTLATAYLPHLGHPHRFMNRRHARYDPNLPPSPCRTTMDGDLCWSAWPNWIRGASEEDYFIGLFERMDSLGGWERAGTLAAAFAKLGKVHGRPGVGW